MIIITNVNNDKKPGMIIIKICKEIYTTGHLNRVSFIFRYKYQRNAQVNYQ
jgi:hypothetical protein